MLLSACGGPLPEELDPSSLSSMEDSALRSEESEEGDEAVAPLACDLVIEACSPNKRTCSVRCCNGSLHEQTMACGGCRTFADDSCYFNGGIWHIRWKE
ncbi:hypothetical protein ACN469_26950 [Corallococcus terminator]